MSRVVPLFKEAADFRPQNQKHEGIKSAFAGFIEQKIVIWTNPFLDRIDRDEMRILGGVPAKEVAPFLAETIYSFLEMKRKEQMKGQEPRESLMSDLVSHVASKNIFAAPRLNMFNGQDLSRGAKLLLACTLNRIFTENKERYAALRNAEVSSGIASVIYDEGRKFIYCATGMPENHPGFGDEMRDFCKKMMGHHALSMSHVEEMVDFHIIRKLDMSQIASPKIKSLSFPVANDLH